jgi:hypothetical protein
LSFESKNKISFLWYLDSSERKFASVGPFPKISRYVTRTAYWDKGTPSKPEYALSTRVPADRNAGTHQLGGGETIRSGPLELNTELRNADTEPPFRVTAQDMDETALSAEQESMAELFAGAVGLCKNSSSHHTGTINDPVITVSLADSVE